MTRIFRKDAARWLLTHRWTLLGVLLIAVVRLAYVWVLFNHHGCPALQRTWAVLAPKQLRALEPGEDIRKADALLYDMSARAFAEDGTLRMEKFNRRIILAPGFPLLQGVLYRIFGRSVVPVLVFYALLDCATGLLLLAFFRGSGLPLSGAVRTGLLATYAFYMPLVFANIYPATEGLFTFLVAAALLSTQVMAGSLRMKPAVSTGVLWGLAALTRPIAVLFPFIWAFRHVACARFDGRAVVHQGVMCVIFLATLMPWTIRNYVQYGRFVLITSDRKPLVMGTDATGTVTRENVAKLAYSDATRGKSVVRLGIGRAWEMLKRPHTYAALWGRKLVQLWFNLGFGTRASAGSLLTAALHAGIICTAWLLFCRDRSMYRGMLAAFTLFGYVTFFHVLFFTTKIRFILPVMPAMLFVSAYHPLTYIVRRLEWD